MIQNPFLRLAFIAFVFWIVPLVLIRLGKAFVWAVVGDPPPKRTSVPCVKKPTWADIACVGTARLLGMY